MPVRFPSHRPIMNPIMTVPPGETHTTPKVKLPSAKDLKNVLSTWAFHSPNHQLRWSTKKPTGAVLKDIVVEKAPAAPRTGSSIVAHVLKSDHTKVYFTKAGSIAPHYFGPVSWKALPEGVPGPILNPIMPR